MNSRATSQRSEHPFDSIVESEKRSTTWPSAAELDLGHPSIDPPYDAVFGHAERFRGDLVEFFEPNDSETLRVFSAPDRHDTIPSPPPELDSAPWHDER